MAKIKKFEEIKSWKKARTLTKEIYEVTSNGTFRRDFGLKDEVTKNYSVLSCSERLVWGG